MPVLLDTRALTAAERIGAVATALKSTTAPCAVRFEDPDERVFTRITAWRAGEADLWRNEGSGMRMTRTARHVAQDADGRFAIAVQERGTSTIDYFDAGVAQHAVPGDLICVDLTKPYEYQWTGTGSAFCLSVPLEALALPPDTLRVACRQVQTSPLYALFLRHLRSLARDVDVVAGDPAAAGVGFASGELLRALVASASHDTRHVSEAAAATTLTQVRTYIQQHLYEPDLDPARIAAALNISLRQLFKVCAQGEFSVEQCIIKLRLDMARTELTRFGNRGRSIGSIARRIGFVDPSHFSRRFKAAYGMAPSEWRAMHEGGTQPPA